MVAAQRAIGAVAMIAVGIFQPFASAADHRLAKVLIGPAAQAAVMPLPLDGAGKAAFAIKANNCKPVTPN
ncbi:hypothetical protein [Roseiarcus sp.]|uniref:hypothetical protein n=1 Tax=Roseiarcus sp. TaxID=1969460 RepID=UPI003F9E5296